MKGLLKTGVLVSLALALSSCATVATRPTGNMGRIYDKGTIYPAVQFDAMMIGCLGGIWQTGDCDNASWPMRLIGLCVVTPLFIVDLPVSAVVDTIMLPIEIKDRRQHGSSNGKQGNQSNQEK